MHHATLTSSSSAGRALKPPKHSCAQVVPLRRKHFSLCYRTASTPQILRALHPNSSSILIGTTTGSPSNVAHVCLWQILLRKSFWGGERKFLEPLMRFMRGNV